MSKPLFEVDKEGLAKILARKGIEFAVTELIQNGWDEDVTEVEVTLEPTDKPGRHRLIVKDDSPEGFRDLSHAYTLFADSYKKGDAEKRGRFNLGEKLVLAICDTAAIKSTKGTVFFGEAGRDETPDRTEAGTIFDAVIRMTKKQAKETENVVFTLLPPPGVTTTFNGRELSQRPPKRTFTTGVTIPTEIADEDGYLRRTRRRTELAIHEPLPGEKAMLYELGIPVVETGDRWHVDVGQKVPLNTDRDNVGPAFLREIRKEVLNHCADLLTEDESAEKWVDSALEDKDIDPEALNTALDKRFGEKRVAFDPSDPEANKLAVAAGYTVVGGRSLSKLAWGNVKAAGAIQAAGQVTPSPKVLTSPDGKPPMDESEWTDGMRETALYVEALALRLLDKKVEVGYHNEATVRFGAWYGRGEPSRFTFNVGTLGYRFFTQGPTVPMNDLIIHEFAHEFCSDHLDNKFHEACTCLGAQLAQLALDEPEFFRAFATDEDPVFSAVVPS